MFTAAGKSAAASAANYIEDVFSTYLYTGTGSSQTITNNIDTSTKGGLVWIKGRSGATGHRLTDTVRGATKALVSNDNSGETTESTGLTAFGTTGFTIGADANYNTNAATYVSWTFREQAKFFDVVTYTGNGSATRSISHSLGSAPGCVIVKQTGAAQAWLVWHRTFSINEYLVLNSTAAKDSFTNVFPTVPDASNFFVGNGGTNTNGATYVAYLFAHDAGGFGAAGTDNVISCGSFTTDGSGNATVNLGYEPQWLLFKVSSTSGDWVMLDTMRGWSDGSDDARLRPNTAVAEALSPFGHPTATGFRFSGGELNATYIYIAIRRGPMQTPTSGTSVFSPVLVNANGGVARTITGVGFPSDLVVSKARTASISGAFVDRLRGATRDLLPSSTGAEFSDTVGLTSLANNDGFSLGADTNGYFNDFGTNYVDWCFRRAPGFFDVVCYTGTGSATTFNHNLTVVPELIIVKSRSGATAWPIYSKSFAIGKYAFLNDVDPESGPNIIVWNNGTPTSTVFPVGTASLVNASAATYVAYLFATVGGVSKVGSYTGTGTTLQVNCGFATGARFVMIKRTDSIGDWYIWDSARGIVAGNDPYLRINSTAAEVTNTDFVDTYSLGFEISSTAPAAINANGGSFIFLAIA